LCNSRVVFTLCLLSICISLFAGTQELARKSKSPSNTHAITSTASGTATFNGIGFYPGYNSSEVRATNADGSVAIGGSGPASPPGTEAGAVGVQWTASGGLVTLPQIPYDGTHG